MSDNVIKLPIRETWLFSVDVIRRRDGEYTARLSDARKSEIDRHGSTKSCLFHMANVLKLAAENMAEEATMFEENAHD